MTAAPIVVDLLLEMHVLNPEDFERQLRIFAADISNPRAARWLTRMGKSMVQNMELLATQPYTPEPKPWLQATGFRGTKHPFGPVEPEKLPTEKMSKDLLTMLVGRERLGGEEQKVNLGPETRPSWWQSEKEPTTGTTVKVPWVKHKRTLPGGGTEDVELEVPQADWERWHSPAYRAVKEALEEAEPFSTALHQPYWQGQIEREFTPYTTKKAPTKTKALFKGPPPAEDSPEWVKMREVQKEPGSAMFFEPTRVHQRPFWEGLQNLVHYFNYLDYARTAYAHSDNEAERAEAAEAEAVFKSLDSMRTNDISGFLNLFTRAQDFPHRAMRIMQRKSVTKVAEHGNLELFRLTTPEAVYMVSNEPTKWNRGNNARWCTSSMAQADYYFGQGNNEMYLVRKEGDPYMLLTPNSRPGFYKNVSDHSDSEKSAETAPLFVNLPERIWQYGEGGLGDAVRQLQGRRGGG